MTPNQQPLLDAGHATFIQSGISIVVGACDARRMPTVARATGCRVAPDLRRCL